MSFKIVRNDITKMHTDAIVNTANAEPLVGPGCDYAVYTAAGYDALLAYRTEKIGRVREGDVFLTPGFDLPAKYIIHAVSPYFEDGMHGEEELLRGCYRKSLALAFENGIRSIAFPLISTGSFGYPKEEGMRIAVDEIHAFLLHADLTVYLVVFDEAAAEMGRRLDPALEAYIDRHYVEEMHAAEEEAFSGEASVFGENADDRTLSKFRQAMRRNLGSSEKASRPFHAAGMPKANVSLDAAFDDDAYETLERKLSERMKHISDTFSQYLLYLTDEKGLTNADVYKRAIIDKKVFSKIKNNPDYHPQKMTALCLCIGAELNLDESRDLLARAGYALSPSDKTDIIFSFFIENGIYDMIELDIQLEEHGLPCVIS